MDRLLLMGLMATTLIAPINANASSDENAKTVAALDMQYQAAVKANDAATMDRIWPMILFS